MALPRRLSRVARILVTLNIAVPGRCFSNLPYIHVGTAAAFSVRNVRQSHRRGNNISVLRNHQRLDDETSSFRSFATKRIPESEWRASAARHAEEVRRLLAPGFIDHADVSATQRKPRVNNDDQTYSGEGSIPFSTVTSTSSNEHFHSLFPPGTRLDPHHPVYNFLIEYYGLSGAKGCKKLARWCPPPEGNAVLLLEGATPQDICDGSLHLRGATLCENGEGVLYDPRLFFNKKRTDSDNDKNPANPFIWYHSILSSTANSEPVLHCYGLHEWAMQYHPPNAPPPPSSKYQKHLPLRVSRETLNGAVERRGVSCTHVDALRFFAPAAGPLNHHGDKLERTDQLRLEQKGCVHAHMDLLKICLRLVPFVNSRLIVSTLELALMAREIDVRASPYDVAVYGLDPIMVETEEGRREYRREQVKLMEGAESVRETLWKTYHVFLKEVFDLDMDKGDDFEHADSERFAVAEPGGLPWRKNLIGQEQ